MFKQVTHFQILLLLVAT